MRCRRGDLAEIINAGPHAQHLIGVRVVVTQSLPRPVDGIPCWLYQTFDARPLRANDGRVIYLLEDHDLRPIRGDEHCEADEMLRRAGKPVGLDMHEAPLQ